MAQCCFCLERSRVYVDASDVRQSVCVVCSKTNIGESARRSPSMRETGPD